MAKRGYRVGGRGEPVEIRLIVGGQDGGSSSSYDDFYAQLADVIRRENPYGEVVYDEYVAYERHGRAKTRTATKPIDRNDIDVFTRVKKVENKELSREEAKLDTDPGSADSDPVEAVPPLRWDLELVDGGNRGNKPKPINKALLIPYEYDDPVRGRSRTYILIGYQGNEGGSG
jgi:hypothetical protein